MLRGWQMPISRGILRLVSLQDAAGGRQKDDVPCKLPANRESGAETGSLPTASPTKQSVTEVDFRLRATVLPRAMACAVPTEV